MERKMPDNSLENESGLARQCLDLAGVILVSIGADQTVKLINKKGCETLGTQEAWIKGRNWFDKVIQERAREEARKAFLKIVAGEAEPEGYFEGPIMLADGSERVIAWHNTALRDECGNIYATLFSGNDVTGLDSISGELNSCRSKLEEILEERARELKDASEQLLREVSERKKAEFELKKLTAVMQQSSNMIFITDEQGNIEYVNRTFEAMTGYSSAEALGRTPCFLISADGEYKDRDCLRVQMFSEEGWQGVLKKTAKNGSVFWNKGSVSPVKDENGRVSHFLCVFEDVTEKRASNEKIKFLAHYDAVTGLHNRSHFIELLNEWIAAAGRDRAGALFLLDIDQFKLISDSYGHGMGDEFLRRVARLLQLTMRYVNAKYAVESSAESFLCRLSGDEFAIFVSSIGRVEAVEIAEQLRKSLECFYQSDVPCHMTVSIGVSLFPEHGTSTTELLTRADAAMYRAKDHGRNRFHFYSPEERDIEQMHSRLKWKENILKALEDDRFEAWLQPIMDLRSGTATHYEVLARMRDIDGSVILPGPFIDIAERFGLVGAISRVVIEKSIKLQARFAGDGRPLTLCINISGKELGDRELLYFIKSKIYESGVDPGSFVFEITETASIHDLDRAISFISALKSMGCHISLDDFGIGFTSFLYLREMQVDYIKIAGSFIKNLSRNLNDQLFVKAITDVAKGMGIKTIAEFVETGETIELIKAHGVDYAQGYLVGRPSPELGPVHCLASE